MLSEAAPSDLEFKVALQAKTIERITNENIRLTQELKDIRSFLAQLPTQPAAPIKVTVPYEQSICEIQIKKLQEKAHLRELTLEETKRLEILIKSLYLVREKTPAATPDEMELPAGTTLGSLATLAKGDNGGD
jgi:hypothetical protein